MSLWTTIAIAAPPVRVAFSRVGAKTKTKVV